MNKPYTKPTDQEKVEYLIKMISLNSTPILACPHEKDLIIKALKDMQRREQGCEYCKDLSNYKVMDTTLYILSSAFNVKDRPVPNNYCPNCGRELKGGAGE